MYTARGDLPALNARELHHVTATPFQIRAKPSEEAKCWNGIRLAFLVSDRFQVGYQGPFRSVIGQRSLVAELAKQSHIALLQRKC